MARPLRLEFPGTLYHVTSRGDGRDDIYLSDNDRKAWLYVMSEVCRRYNWVCHAYCLMSNHYHLLIETPEANLSMGMRQLNGVYTQRFNRSHSRVGHVFQGRYKVILVDKENFLLELSRYIVLDPVCARMVRAAKDWKWSSYRATAGFEPVYPWLKIDWLLSVFAKRRKIAYEKYREFVAQGKNQASPWELLRNQVFLGGDNFIKEMQALIGQDEDISEVPLAQKRKHLLSVGDYAKKFQGRNKAIYEAFKSGGFKMKEIADYFGLHYSSVSKIIKGMEDS